eukprot:TRINITY_DN18748_c0_g1_i1.p1 TRINITY_DN18748_c0_g1~~TRINITY_DN18748_c0_g1_i1.p1  ORF type:complete len:241 (-),score=66.54 TRINITY_DN18748_c0_g1_i1:124-846(-)
MGKMGYHPVPKEGMARTDLPKMFPEDHELGIRYHPETAHDKVSRFNKHTSCDASWLAPDPSVHGLANSSKNRVYPKEQNFMYTEQEEEPVDPLKTDRIEIQVHFRGNAVRGPASMGHRIMLVVQDKESILELKERVQDQMLDRDADRDYKPEQMLLFLHDELLEDSNSVAHYGIKKYQTLNAQMKVGFGTHDGLFTTVAKYKWRKKTGFEKDKNGDPVMCDGYGMDHDSRFPEGYDSDDE